MKFENNRQGWDRMVDVFSDHPASGYRLRATRTWYPGQKIELWKGENMEFSIDGHEFAGAELDEETWKLTIYNTDGEETVIDLDGRKNSFDTLSETIAFMRRADIEIPDSAKDYGNLQVYGDRIVFVERVLEYKNFVIDESNFKNARIHRGLGVLTIYLEGPSVVSGHIFFEFPFKEKGRGSGKTLLG